MDNILDNMKYMFYLRENEIIQFITDAEGQRHVFIYADLIVE